MDQINAVVTTQSIIQRLPRHYSTIIQAETQGDHGLHFEELYLWRHAMLNVLRGVAEKKTASCAYYSVDD